MTSDHTPGWVTKPRSRSVACNGSLVKHYREQLGWTQERLADVAGYSDRLIRKAERGLPINADTIEDLAEALCAEQQVVTPEQLIADPRATAHAFCDLLSRDAGNAGKATEKLLADNLDMSVAGDPDMFDFAGKFDSPSGYDLFLRRLYGHMYCPDPNIYLPSLNIVGMGDEVVAYGMQCMQAYDAPVPIYSHLIFHFTFDRGQIVRIQDEYNTVTSREYFEKYVPNFLTRRLATDET